MSTAEELAPIDLIAVEFPSGCVGGDGFAKLLDLAESGTVAVLDVEFVAKADDGTVSRVAVTDVPTDDGVDLSEWDGASSSLLDDDDLAELASTMDTGAIVVVVVFENRWIFGLIDSWRSAGARLIVDGGIPVDDLVAALDASDSK